MVATASMNQLIWEKTRAPRGNLQLLSFNRACTYTLFTWGLGHIDKPLLRFELASLEVVSPSAFNSTPPKNDCTFNL